MALPLPNPASPSPSQPSGPQGPEAGAQPGQPPIGSSPATQPVPNRGLEAAGVAKIGVVVRLLEQIVPLVGAGSEAGRDVLKSLTMLSKHVSSGGSAQGIEQQALMEQLMKARQMAPQIAAMRAAQPSPQMMQGGPTPPPNLAAMMQGRPQGNA